MNKELHKIVIIRLSALGDIVNTAVVLQFIKERYPDIKIDWVTEEVFAPLLQNHPLINKVHTLNLKKLKKEKSFSLLKQNVKELLSLGEYDVILDIQGLLKSAIVARLIGANTHGYDKTSARESIASLLYKTTSHIAYEESIVKRNCFVACDGLNFKINDTMILNKKPIFELPPITLRQTENRNIALVIGASWESKKYPKEKQVELSESLQENIVLIWGTQDELKEAEWISSRSKYAVVAPKLSLSELVAFISSFDLLIGNDTGPTHMAWAQNIPSITLFGPTTNRMIYETPINRSIKSPSTVNIQKIDKQDFSIKEIAVSKIVTMAKELLYGI